MPKHLYPGNKKSMVEWTWDEDEIKNGIGHKDEKVEEFSMPLEIGIDNLAICSEAEAPSHVEYYSKVL